MNQLVIHHTYLDGSTFDVSGMGNHGRPQDVVPATGKASGSFSFAKQTSGITVPPSSTLNRLTAIKLRVRFRLDSEQPVRRNLVEGHVAFALYLMPHGALQGTILCSDGVWRGPISAQGVVSSGQWHEAALLHDGIDRAIILLDGAVVGESMAPGPVGSAGPYGVAIGRWPDRSQFVFSGLIGELQFWRYDPITAVHGLLDPCCRADPARLHALAGALSAQGVTWKDTFEAGWLGLLSVITLLQQVRGADQAAGRALEESTTRGLRAARAGDLAAVRRERREATRIVVEAVGEPALEAAADALRPGADLLGLDGAQVERLLAGLCLEGFGAGDPGWPGPEPSDSQAPWDQRPSIEEAVRDDARDA